MTDPLPRTVDLPEDADALIVVDAQNGFLNEHTRRAASEIVRLVRQADRLGVPVLVSRFTNHPGSLYRTRVGWHRCGPGTHESELIPELAGHVVLDKSGYGAQGMLADRCGSLRISSPLLAGIDTDSCVLACAIELFDRGIWPRIAASACGSTGGPQFHEAGLSLLRRMLGSAAILEGE